MRIFDPIREIDQLRREVERVFDNTVYHRGYTLTKSLGRVEPLLNVDESEDKVTVEALVPGYDADSLDVSVLGKKLTVSGEKLDWADNNEKVGVHRRERNYGSFKRTVTLPAEIDADNISASYENGILRIELAKSEAAKPRQIAVSVAQ